MLELEKRIRVLEDIEAIKQLKARYCYLADAGIAGDLGKYDELMTYFIEDCRVDFPGFGVQQGKGAVRTFFRETVHSLWSYAAHMVMNPVIEVSGEDARGTWFVHVACTARAGGKAVWVQGKYEEEYCRERGGWKWRSIRFVPDFFTPFEDGWAKTPFMDFG